MKLKNVIITGLLAAFALVFNIFEGYLPMPLPGIKLGAANVFSLVALVLLGIKEAFAVTLIRVFLAWVMTGNWFAFLCSLAGGLMSAAVMSSVTRLSGPIHLKASCSRSTGFEERVSHMNGISLIFLSP